LPFTSDTAEHGFLDTGIPFFLQGTYFFQNEVFEDESAGEVAVPLRCLGARRPVYLGRSIEGVLRHRGARELQLLFRQGYVCISIVDSYLYLSIDRSIDRSINRSI